MITCSQKITFFYNIFLRYCKEIGIFLRYLLIFMKVFNFIHDFFLEILHLLFNCYLAAPNVSHYWGGSFTHPMLITAILFLTQRSSGDSKQQGWAHKPCQAPSGDWTQNLPFFLASKLAQSPWRIIFSGKTINIISMKLFDFFSCAEVKTRSLERTQSYMGASI